LTKVILWKALHPAPPSSLPTRGQGFQAGRFLWTWLEPCRDTLCHRKYKKPRYSPTVRL